jgi:hypothetical protein
LIYENHTRSALVVLVVIVATSSLFKFTTFAQTVTGPTSADVVETATSSVVQTTIGTSSALMVGTSSPAMTTTASLGTEVNVPWISDVLPWRPSSVAKIGTDRVIIANDYQHATALLLRVNASSSVSKIATFNSSIYDFAIDGKNFIVTTGDGDVLKVSAKGTVTTIAKGVTAPGFASSVAVASSTYLVTDYLRGSLIGVATDGSTTIIANGLRHITKVLVDGSDYVLAATDNQTSEPYLYRVTTTGTTTPIANLRPLLDFGQVTGIAKVGSDYYVSSDTRIVRLTPDGTVSPIVQTGHNIEGLANDGANLLVAEFSTPSLTLLATTTSITN